MQPQEPTRNENNTNLYTQLVPNMENLFPIHVPLVYKGIVSTLPDGRINNVYT